MVNNCTQTKMNSKKKLNVLNTAINKINKIRSELNKALTTSVKEYVVAMELLIPEIEIIVNFWDYREHYMQVGSKEHSEIFFDFGFDVNDEKLRSDVVKIIGGTGFPHKAKEKDVVYNLLNECDTQLIRIQDDGKFDSSCHQWKESLSKLVDSNGVVDRYHLRKYLGRRSDNKLLCGSEYRDAEQEHPEAYREILLRRREISMQMVETAVAAIEKIGTFMLNIADEEGNKPKNWLELFQQGISIS